MAVASHLSKMLLTGALIAALLPTPLFAFTYNVDNLLPDAELEKWNSMNRTTIQRFLLERGTLGTYQAIDIDGKKKPAADIIARVAETYRLNPKFLIALLQREQSLIEDRTPSADQFSWAVGYAVCDSCSKNDPVIQKYKGFAKQLEGAAARIRGEYLRTLSSRSVTLTGVGPGKSRVIDGVSVTPANFATAILYTYTPHLQGNINFAKIWHRYFDVPYPDGTLLKGNSPTVWLIQGGKRRPFHSWGAFASRYTPSQIVKASQSQIDTYEEASPIRFENYALLQDETGQKYLLRDDRLLPMSDTAFYNLAFNPDELVPISQTELADYLRGPELTEETESIRSELVKTTQGKYYLLADGKHHAILNEDIVKNRFPDEIPRLAAEEEIRRLQEGDTVLFQNGMLLKARGNSRVYFISNGVRRPILNAKIFKSYGWSFKQVVETSPEAVELHPLGNPLPALSQE